MAVLANPSSKPIVLAQSVGFSFNQDTLCGHWASSLFIFGPAPSFLRMIIFPAKSCIYSSLLS